MPLLTMTHRMPCMLQRARHTASLDDSPKAAMIDPEDFTTQYRTGTRTGTLDELCCRNFPHFCTTRAQYLTASTQTPTQSTGL